MSPLFHFLVFATSLTASPSHKVMLAVCALHKGKSTNLVVLGTHSPLFSGSHPQRPARRSPLRRLRPGRLYRRLQPGRGPHVPQRHAPLVPRDGRQPNGLQGADGARGSVWAVQRREVPSATAQTPRKSVRRGPAALCAWAEICWDGIASRRAFIMYNLHV